MSTASKVAQAKIDHPEDFCPTPRCLWRTFGHYTPCPRHASQHDGTSGQDRKSYSDTQDRKSYA